MPDTQQEKNTATKDEPRSTFRDDHFIEVYANVSHAGLTPWDIQLTFSRLDSSDGTTRTRELVSVVVSPQHAKALSAVIQNSVRIYEETFGEIKLTEGQQPNLHKKLARYEQSEPGVSSPKKSATKK